MSALVPAHVPQHVLITGGCGFIGSNFVRHLLETDPALSVVNLDALTYCGNPENLRDVEARFSDRYRFVHGDIRDPAAAHAAMAGRDTVVHFAAESHVDRSIAKGHDFITTNFEGTYTLLEEARSVGVRRFVHISTDEVYGSSPTGFFGEEDPLVPSSPYSASKAASDLLVLSFRATYGLPVVITRSTNNFGPYQYPEKLIPLFTTNLLDGKTVPLYGDGQNVREWLYVLDNCRAIDTVMRFGAEGEIYNVGSGKEMANRSIAAILLDSLGFDDRMIEYVTDRPGHDRRYAVRSDKVRSLGWSPLSDFRQALLDTVEWYRGNRAWWEPLTRGIL